MNPYRVSAVLIVFAALSASSVVGQENPRPQTPAQTSPATPAPATPAPATPAPAVPGPEAAAPGTVNDEVFIPSEEISADEEVTFPVGI